MPAKQTRVLSATFTLHYSKTFPPNNYPGSRNWVFEFQELGAAYHTRFRETFFLLRSLSSWYEFDIFKDSCAVTWSMPYATAFKRFSLYWPSFLRRIWEHLWLKFRCICNVILSNIFVLYSRVLFSLLWCIISILYASIAFLQFLGGKAILKQFKRAPCQLLMIVTLSTRSYSENLS